MNARCAWPAGFAATGKVWRSKVFALAECWRARDVSSVQLAAGVLAWDTGSAGTNRFRTPTKLPGLGAAFFTKLLYFAGYRTAWWTGTWLAYLRWAAAQSVRPEFGDEPDRVEMAVFAGSWSP